MTKDAASRRAAISPWARRDRRGEEELYSPAASLSLTFCACFSRRSSLAGPRILFLLPAPLGFFASLTEAQSAGASCRLLMGASFALGISFILGSSVITALILPGPAMGATSDPLPAFFFCFSPLAERG